MIAWYWLVPAAMVGGLLALVFFCACAVGKACDERCGRGE